jgi:hypothetical protein
MRLILFGGAETNQGVAEIKLIGEVINRIQPEQVLHIPFSRTTISEPEWEEGWFSRHIQLTKTVYLNAANKTGLTKADKPLIFISGGSDNANLYEKITSSPQLLDLIANAEYIIGESAGSTVLGEYRKSNQPDGSFKLMKQLGIIKDTVIVPHYTERNRQQALSNLIEETGVKYGLGIDCMTAIEFELDKFPEKFNKIGDGKIEVKSREVRR